MLHGLEGFETSLVNPFVPPVGAEVEIPKGYYSVVLTVSNGREILFCSHPWAYPRTPYLMGDAWADMWGALP